MKKKTSAGSLISKVIIWAVVIGLTLSCLLPLLNMIAISLSGSDAVSANEVGLWPRILMYRLIRSCWGTDSSGNLF